MQDGEGVVIVDAGGGMINISSYSKNLREELDLRKWQLLSVISVFWTFIF